MLSEAQLFLRKQQLRPRLDPRGSHLE
ncbi:hypothetical protein [Paenibacillus anaericanus]